MLERMRSFIQSLRHRKRATIYEGIDFATACKRNRVLLRGDACELEQLFKTLAVDTVSSARFWAAAPLAGHIRKAHSGLPALMVTTLASLVKADLNEVDIPQKDRWKPIAEENDFTALIGQAVQDALAIGDGAFKITLDQSVSAYPLISFVPGDRVEFPAKHGRATAVIFKSEYRVGDTLYTLHEIYEKGAIRYQLFDEHGEVPLARVPALSGYQDVYFSKEVQLAIPFCIYKSEKYPTRGRSVFEHKIDAFDAHDEVISQWIDAIRGGRVKHYIPEEMIPRDAKTGRMQPVDSFGTNFIAVQSPLAEGTVQKIETVQPEISYEAFLQSYQTTLDMCLHGILSPATLGIDIGRTASAPAQRERKDITGFTRTAITDALEKTLPRVICAALQAEDLQNHRPPDTYTPHVSFGEYGAPDFDSRVATIAAAAAAGVMSVETQVEELWAQSKDDAWKQAEVARLKGGDLSGRNDAT